MRQSRGKEKDQKHNHYFKSWVLKVFWEKKAASNDNDCMEVEELYVRLHSLNFSARKERERIAYEREKKSFRIQDEVKITPEREELLQSLFTLRLNRQLAATGILEAHAVPDGKG